MTFDEFRALVANMRRTRKAYVAGRKLSDLNASEDFERRADAALAAAAATPGLFDEAESRN